MNKSSSLMHDGCIRAAPTADPAHQEMSETRGVSAPHAQDPRAPAALLSVRLQSFCLNGCDCIRSVEAAATPHPKS